jgi:hypothetical protein
MQRSRAIEDDDHNSISIILAYVFFCRKKNILLFLSSISKVLDQLLPAEAVLADLTRPEIPSTKLQKVFSPRLTIVPRCCAIPP